MTCKLYYGIPGTMATQNGLQRYCPLRIERGAKMSFRSTNETFRFLQFAVLFMTASLVVTSTCLAQGSEGKIAFFSNRHDDSGIYIMDADGANPFRLVGGGGPAWSPDGAQIALYGGNGVGSDIFVVDANGNNLRSLTKSRIDGNRFPVWSPDGATIAFVSDRDGQIDIYLMTADGKNPRNLTFDLREEDRPSWSPDGKRVVFGAYQRNPQGNRAESEVFVMDADGANRVNLTQNPRASEFVSQLVPGRKKDCLSSVSQTWSLVPTIQHPCDECRWNQSRYAYQRWTMDIRITSQLVSGRKKDCLYSTRA